MSGGVETIDVARVIAETPLDELNRLAEEYFAQLNDWSFHLAKPFSSIDEAPQLLINFAVVLQGLNLCPGLTVLEFGAGSCWASRYLTQLGCRVIAADVSPTALRIGRELYDRQPIIGNKPEPQFLLFDGRRFALSDESVDRIICLDALHHVPNIEQVLGEMGRVLCKGGIAGFAEPGPEHSHSEQSQREMREFGIVENDIDIRQIRDQALAAGFTDIKLAVFNVPAFHLSLDDFEGFVAGRREIVEKYSKAVRNFAQDQRNFFLYKGPLSSPDSRFRANLTAKIGAREASVQANANEAIIVHAVVTNNSPSVWLPRAAGLGAVLLGVHVCNREGQVLKHSYHWEALTPGEGRSIQPGETVAVQVNIPGLPAGEYLLRFDMVSHDVCWFASNGSTQFELAATVTQ